MATRYRFGLEAYERLFRGVKNVELLEGEVYEMSPIGPRHAWKVARLVRAFLEALGDQAVVWPQNPIRIPPHSEPQPDLALLKPRDYGEALPTPEDVLLLVEVADSGLDHDQERKLPIYAQAGIPEVWILDLEQNLLHAFRHPKEGSTRSVGPSSPGRRRSPWPSPG
jgi:Uma2 family endonuclease